MKRLILLSLAVVLCLSFAGNVQAAASTSSLYVYTYADVVCIIYTPYLDFGTYTGSVISQTTTIDVQCTTGTPYTISMDEGYNFSGLRRMTDDTMSNFLDYQLTCEDAPGSGPSFECGDGVTIGDIMSGTGDGSAQSWTVYGDLYDGQFVPSGDYSDVVTVTLTY